MQARAIIVGRGYTADTTLAHIEWQRGAVATIPPPVTRTLRCPCIYVAYKERDLILCLISSKYFCRIFAHFDKYASRYLASVRFASTIIRLR